MIPKTTRSGDQNNRIIRILNNKLYRQIFLVVVSAILAIVLIFAGTMAWFSNVIFSDGLNFQATPWGFEGSASLGNEIIKASPGSSGSIPLTVSNPTDEILSVSVNISKNTMSSEIQKRIFFYADSTRTSNGENTDKIYLNKLENYSYTLLGGQQLDLTDNSNNNTQIKWEWVYDVVGYYVLASVSTNSQRIEDYLRPVEYDYDKATFDIAGNLVTVDGTKTVVEFLHEVTLADGYAGSIDEETVPVIANNEAYAGDSAAVRKYYPVEVDANGYGVWIYLCTRGEIEHSMLVDTDLGKAMAAAVAAGQNPVQFNALINVIGRQKELKIVEAATITDLKTAVADSTHNYIKLDSDITLSEDLLVRAGKEKIIDLNGHTMTLVDTATTYPFTIAALNSDLYIMNGSVDRANSSNKILVYSYGSNVSLNNVTVRGIRQAVGIYDYSGNSKGKDSNIYISNCDIETREYSVLLYGNGSQTPDAYTYLTIENSTIRSTERMALSGNGSNGCDGTRVVIKNSTLEGKYAAIYQPQADAYTHVVNSHLKGFTALAVKGGDVLVEDSIVESIPAEGVTPVEPTYGNSGFTDTGDGVYVETNYKWNMSVEIKGDCIIKGNPGCYAVRKFSADAGNATVIISGGRFNTRVPAEYLAPGYSCSATADAEGYYTVSAD